MNKLIGAVVLFGLLSGCFVRTRGPGYSSRRGGGRACPPAYHWERGVCVHNGNGRGNGNGNGKVRDHR